MAMPSTFSIGDVFLLAQTACTIAKAFSAANSAPAEFAEIQNLLYSVSESLKLLARTLPGHPNTRNDGLPNAGPQHLEEDGTYALVMKMITGCQSILYRLEDFVNKYSALHPDVDPSGEHGWKSQIKKNWKKVTWTTEESDIAKLKQTLTAHTNTLNLAVAIISRGKQTVMQDKLEVVKEKLDEIHEWFTTNLKDKQASTHRESSKELSNPATDDQELTFRVHEDTVIGAGMESVILCPRATFEGSALSLGLADFNVRSIFRCCCHDFENSGPEMKTVGHSSRLQFKLLPVSVLVRLAHSSEQGNWQMYVASPNINSPVSLILKETSPVYLRKFEDWANRLAMLQAANHMANNVDSAFVLRTSESMSVLSMKANSAHLGPRLLSVRFAANGSQFSLNGSEGLQLLHYASMPKDSWDPNLTYETTPSVFSHAQHASIIVTRKTSITNPYSMVESAERYLIQVTRETTFLAAQGVRYVAMHNVLCLKEGRVECQQQPDSIRCQEVEFEFSDALAAEEFLRTLKDMKQKLLVQYLQHARFGEQVVYQQHVGDIMIRNVFLRDAHLKIVLDPQSTKCRMIVLRGDHSASVTFELPSNFFEELGGGAVAMRPNYPAWFVEVRPDGVSVTKDGSGINPLLPLGGKLRLVLRLSREG